MSQHDLNIANQGFPATRADLNNALAALASNSSGTSEPSTTYANQLWYDTANDLLKFRNEADSAWITLAYMNQTTSEWEIRSGVVQAVDSDGILFKTDEGITRFMLDDSGNLLVGTTTQNTVGVTLDADGYIYAKRDDNDAAYFDRDTSDGGIAVFRKDGSTVGTIGTLSGFIYIGHNDVALSFRPTLDAVLPFSIDANGNRDNAIDLGYSSVRFDDVYATNGTIQTSDQNEKQQIASLTDVEITAAKEISKLFKTFKWNDSVAEKGDDARIHTGVIAQEVEQAMTDAGLDAGDYAFFISSTWWETQTEVPATKDKEAYTRTDTYDTEEEAPEGATERNRKGIRYPELLSFVSAATEQRLASIEARLDVLEG